MLDNIGIPNAWGSLAQGDVPTIAATDGEILISLNREKHGPARDYEVLLRKRLDEKFPGHGVLLPAGQHHQPDSELRPARADRSAGGRPRRRGQLQDRAADSRDRIARIPGAADVHVHQVFDQPQLNLNVDRVKAGQLGLTQRDVTSSMLISLSGNNQVAPNFWLNPANGVNYNVGVQTPQYRIDSLDALLRTPVTAPRPAPSTRRRRARWPARRGGQRLRRRVAERRLAGLRKSRRDASGTTQLLSNLVDVKRGYGPVIVNHYNVSPVFDVYANVDRRDLGSVGAEVEKIMHEEAAAPAARHHARRCAASTRRCSRPSSGLGLGMIFAVVLVYLLMTVNFQSWLDPFIILTALPGAMAGILWMLFVTGTTLSVPVADGRHHVHRRRDGQQHSDGDVRQRRARNNRLRPRGDAVGRLRPHPAGADDRDGHDSRHAADGARPRRRRRAECAARHAP